MLTIGINKNIINKGLASTRGWQNHTFNSIQELTEHIKQGYAWTCGLLIDDDCNKKPSNNDIAHASLVAIDIDNSTSKKQRRTQREGYISIESFERTELYQLYGSFLYTSHSHTENWHRFRVVFQLPYEVHEIEYKRIATALSNMFKADNTTDISRLWYGAKNCYVNINDKFISADYIQLITKNKDFEEKVEELDTHINANKLNRPNFTTEQLQYILSKIPENPGYNEWLYTLSGIANYLNNDTLAETIIDNWSPCTGKQTTLDKIRNRTKHTISYVIRLALEFNPNDKELLNIIKSDPNTKNIIEVDINDEYTDYYNAKKFWERYSNIIRFNHNNNKWYAYNGIKWKEDDTGEEISKLKDDFISHSIKTIKRKLSEPILSDDKDKDKNIRKQALAWIKSLGSRRKQDDMIKLVSNMPKVAVTTEDFDKHKNLFNFLNGTLNLDTKQFKEHDPADMITKQVYFNYDKNEKCYSFTKAIDMLLMENDIDGDINQMPEYEEHSLRDFFYESLALCLHGEIFTEAIWFMFGSGANGKTVISSFFFDFMGDYAKKLPASSLIERGETIPNDIAMLTGARFVLAEEMPDGKTMNVSKIKEITGGDKLTARFLHQEYFEFTPQFKLWLYGNNKPRINDNSEGFWRRIQLIPFLYTVPKNERRPKYELHEKFMNEATGIFNLLLFHLDNFRKRNELLAPTRVKELNHTYRSESDILIDFLNTYFDYDERKNIPEKDVYKEKLQDVYTIFKFYTKDDLSRLTIRKFKIKLCERENIESKRFGTNQVGIFGIKIKDEYRYILEKKDNIFANN